MLPSDLINYATNDYHVDMHRYACLYRFETDFSARRLPNTPKGSRFGAILLPRDVSRNQATKK
jgi:hypothetical protein